jgi:N-acetyl-beta-hexosaminidase
MTCSAVDLKAYFLGELAQAEKTSVDDHVRACQGCREELDQLRLTQTALMSLEEEEIPQRIAFVSDKVFEPRWWQTIWRSGPVMGFASAAMLAVAILAHGYIRPVAASAPTQASVDTTSIDITQIEQRIEREVNARLETTVAKAVSDSEAKQSREFAQVLNASEQRFEAKRKDDLAVAQQAARYFGQQTARLMVAANDSARPAQ